MTNHIDSFYNPTSLLFRLKTLLINLVRNMTFWLCATNRGIFKLTIYRLLIKLTIYNEILCKLTFLVNIY